jgi:hypothetical protein
MDPDTSIASAKATTSPLSINPGTNVLISTNPSRPFMPRTTMKDDVLVANERSILNELQSISRVLSDSNTPIKSQELLYFLLQFFGILAATVFGVFSILAWSAANKSNAISTKALELALQNNQLALLSFCYEEQYDVSLYLPLSAHCADTPALVYTTRNRGHMFQSARGRSWRLCAYRCKPGPWCTYKHEPGD